MMLMMDELCFTVDTLKLFTLCFKPIHGVKHIFSILSKHCFTPSWYLYLKCCQLSLSISFSLSFISLYLQLCSQCFSSILHKLYILDNLTIYKGLSYIHLSDDFISVILPTSSYIAPSHIILLCA